MLGEDQLTVGHDVEDAVVALDELCLDSQLPGERGLQTGGPREVVSTNAVGDRDLHGTLLKLWGPAAADRARLPIARIYQMPRNAR